MSERLLSNRPLGRTGLFVSPLCVGGAPLGDMPETFAYNAPEENALATIRAAFASQINFLDTAAAYGEGESERRIGKVIKENGGLPSGYVLATKADRCLQTGDFSGEQIKRSIEGSLLRLGLDRLQYVYIHDPEHTTFENVMGPGGPLEVLKNFKDQGVIDHIGISGGPIQMLIRYVETGEFSAVETHNRYTLLNRSAEPLLDVASRLGVAVINAAPYGSGILAKGPDAYARYAYSDAPPLLLERARLFVKVCQEYDVPLAAAALQFSMCDSRVTSTVVGMTKPERVAQTLELASYPIPSELWSALDAIGFDTADPESESI
jgi:D-threo-aldose 1-dehydrogenase